MADQQNQFPILPACVSQVAVSVTASEIIISLGQSRIVFKPDENGNPAPIVAIEWTSAVSIPPPVGKALSDSLIKAIEVYEATFGKIPSDPNAKMQTSDLLAIKPA